MPKLPKPWEKYRTPPSDGIEIDQVFHVSHLDSGLKIINDRIIRPSLVSDESKLKTERITVNWVSPNAWAPGYRYGNVRFCFDIAEIFGTKKIYWVEDMTKYSPIAVRFLVTDNDYTRYGLVEYDPLEDHGPLRRRKDKWLMRDRLTVEFMLDDPLYISECTSIDFVKHHDTMCCLDGPCTQKGLTVADASTRFLATLIMLPSKPSQLSILGEKTAKGRGPGNFSEAIWRVIFLAGKVESYSGKVKNLPFDAKTALLIPFFHYLTIGDKKGFKACISIFGSKSEFQDLFLHILETRIGITDFDFLDEG